MLYRPTTNLFTLMRHDLERIHIRLDSIGSNENARPDIARPSKLWGLTSQDRTTRHHIARVDIARLDNAAPD